MEDLTTGPLTRHLLKTTSFMLVTMIFQTLYFLIDLYWVGRLGTDAIAAVGIAGNLTFIVLALTQMLGVGTTTVVSHAIGRRDRDGAQLMFNQAQMLAIVTGAAFLVVGLLARVPYARAMAPDPVTATLANQYLLWFIPAMGLQFLMVAAGAALRGVGNFKTGMIVATGSVIINMILAPFLIFGWVTHHAFGVAGAAMSSLIAIVVAIVWFAAYFVGKNSYLRFVRADQKPQLQLWKKMLNIGLPAGFEFLMMAVYLIVVYSLARPFGAAAQAGFGIGQRVIQSMFMPAVALGFSVAPVAGQNFGARSRERVIDTFRKAAYMVTGLMVLLIVIGELAPRTLIGVFSKDPAVLDVGGVYLRIVSWTFIASGLIFVASSMFQAMGNTIPSLVASGVRVLLVAVPAIILSRTPGFHLNWIWYLSVGAVFIQLALSMFLLRREFSRRLTFTSQPRLDGTAIASALVAAE
ncbi:MAG TPA: MATE family efflux transporter [Gemmatimonadaceae bacterium]|jgi:putative MATE family efflux protein|nr:MATE family efflux transporter [Gemmatimonadaceae bacterium]